MSFCFVYKLEKDVVDGSSNECSQVEEFTVDSVQGSFEEIPLSRVFTVKELEQLIVNDTLTRKYSTYRQDESLINVLFTDIRVEFGTLYKAEEEFVYNLQMWPGELQNRFVFLGVKGVARRVDLGRDRPEKVRRKLKLAL